MKCYIAIRHEDQEGAFPDHGYMKALGHDLTRLLTKITSEHYGGRERPLVQAEYDYITNDHVLAECIRILSLFGRFGRYYNLDVVAGSPHDPTDPKAEWETLQSQIEDSAPYLADMEALFQDYYPRVHAVIIGKLERFVRAIALQFTVGDHADSKRRLSTTSCIYSNFRHIKDEELGTRDYRRSVHILKQKDEDTWTRLTNQKIKSSRWPSKQITKGEFLGEWPFRAQEVVVELRDKLFCIAYIEGYAFSLNGAARSKFNYPFPHDAGVAILGKSVGPFSEMARALV